MSDERIVDLDEFGDDCRDDAVIQLQMLVELHGESHRRWRITPSKGGAWNYEKAEIRECVCGNKFEVVVKHAKPWTVCPDCLMGR